MNIAIIGTGMVGQTLAAKFAELGHTVTMGTRNAAATMARTAPPGPKSLPFRSWLEQFPKVTLVSYADAATQGEIVVNATKGSASLEALRSSGEKNLEGKILIDIANPLEFSKGNLPSLTVCNTDSLAEQIQRAFPKARVVKTLNTVNARLMTDPALVAGGDHHMFVCGDDADAKAKVTEILTTWFGWKNVIDLGGISSARLMEMLLPLWIRLMGMFQTPMFNFKVVR